MKTMVLAMALVMLTLPCFGQNSINSYKGNYDLWVYSKKDPIMHEIEIYLKDIQQIIGFSEISVDENCVKNIDYTPKRMYGEDTIIVDTLLCDCFPMKKYGTNDEDRLWIRTKVAKESFFRGYSGKYTIEYVVFLETDKKGRTLVTFSFEGTNKHIESYQENQYENKNSNLYSGDVKCRVYDLEMGLMKHLKSKFKTSPVK